jgi:hypothetical protein
MIKQAVMMHSLDPTVRLKKRGLSNRYLLNF